MSGNWKKLIKQSDEANLKDVVCSNNITVEGNINASNLTSILPNQTNIPFTNLKIVTRDSNGNLVNSGNQYVGPNLEGGIKARVKTQDGTTEFIPINSIVINNFGEDNIEIVTTENGTLSLQFNAQP